MLLRPPCLPCRGVIMEALDRFDEAIADYKAVLAAAPNDPAAYNNLASLPRRLCPACFGPPAVSRLT